MHVVLCPTDFSCGKFLRSKDVGKGERNPEKPKR